MAAQKRSWSDLSPQSRTAIIVLSVFEAIFTFIAVRDLRKRPRDQVRGPKLLWTLSFAIQPVGPIAYLGFGRRRSEG